MNGCIFCIIFVLLCSFSSAPKYTCFIVTFFFSPFTCGKCGRIFVIAECHIDILINDCTKKIHWAYERVSADKERKKEKGSSIMKVEN